MKKFAVIGYPLTHSMSPQLHAMLAKESGADIDYTAIETPPHLLQKQVEAFRESFDGFNVTIPYKSDVMRFLDEIDDDARALGAVNTVSVENGKMKGYNTDYSGFKRSLEHFYNVKGKQVLVLGNGGAARAVVKAAKDLGGIVTVCGREQDKVSAFAQERGVNAVTYEKISDATLLINTTPLGMFPHCNESALCELPKGCEAVLDIIYNPLKSKLLKTAQQKGAKFCNGIEMFVNQAADAQTIWGIRSKQNTEGVCERLSYLTVGANRKKKGKGIALCGFMGAGKTTQGKRLAEEIGLDFYDSDQAIEAEYGKISLLFEKGERAFRDAETEVLKKLPSLAVVALGGGAVLRQENVEILRKKYDIVFLDTPFCEIQKRLENDTTRPLAKNKQDLLSLYNSRLEIYRQCSDAAASELSLPLLEELEW